MSRNSFRKEDRLRRRREFLAVEEKGEKFSADCLLALAMKNDRPHTRAGFTVSGKVGNAVARNRVRRRLRELFRTRREKLPKGLDVVFIARQSAAAADFRRLERAFESLAQRMSRHFG